MISIQGLQLHRGFLRGIALLCIVCMVGCSTPATPQQKALRAGLISGGAAAAITLALGGDAGQAVAIGVGVGSLTGAVVYVRNEIAISRENVDKAESELARLRTENSTLSRKLEDVRGQRLAAFQVGNSKKIVVLDTRTGKAVERTLKTSAGEPVSAPVGLELSSIPAAPGEEAKVAYRTDGGDAEKSFPVLFMGKI